MNARYYIPTLNRFLSADTIVPQPTNPQSFNRYSYVNNRPLNFTDPSGHVLDAGCETEGCAGYDDFFEEAAAKREVLDALDEAWRLECIAQGDSCLPNRKFRLFGIPSTDAQWAELIAQKATTLCNSGGTCSTRQVKIHVNIMTLGLSGIVSGVSTGIGWIGTFFNGGFALGSDEPFKNTAMVGIKKGLTEGVGYTGGKNVLNLNNVPLYKAPLSAIGIGLDLLELPADVEGYIPVAREQVALEVSQAERAFLSAHFSTIHQPGHLNPARLGPYSTPQTGPWNPNYDPNTNWQSTFNP